MEMKESDYCFGCSQTNPCGLKLKIVQICNKKNKI